MMLRYICQQFFFNYVKGLKQYLQFIIIVKTIQFAYCSYKVKKSCTYKVKAYLYLQIKQIFVIQSKHCFSEKIIPLKYIHNINKVSNISNKANMNMPSSQPIKYRIYLKSNQFTKLQNTSHIQTRQLKPIRKMQLRQGVKQLHFCKNQQMAILLTSDSILVANTIYGQITCIIKKLAYPRYITLSKDGKLILAYYSDNTVTIMNTRGQQISNVIGVPRSSNIFLISNNCKKLMYGSNQQICLWDIQKAEIQVMTRQWKNINCYAISDDGEQFALGTYSGSIFVLTIVGDQKVTEFQIKRHTSCVMCLVFHGKNLASVSYDKLYIQTTVQTNQQNQKILTYYQHMLNDVPRSLISCGDKVYMSYLSGLFWLTNGKMLGFTQGTWNVIENFDKETIFIKYDKAEIQWWKFQ